MITAEQARSLMIDEEKLKEIEDCVTSAAKQGRYDCEIYVPCEEDYTCFADILRERGFEVSYERDLVISWWNLPTDDNTDGDN